MAKNNRDWDDLGKEIQDIVNKALNSKDFRSLDQTIRQAVGQAVDLGTEAVRKAVDVRDAAPRTDAPTVPVRDPSELYRKPNMAALGAAVKLASGIVICCVAVVVFLGAMTYALISDGAAWTAVGMDGLLLACGIWLICSGTRTLGWIKRFKVYRRILGQKTHCTLERLARGVDKSVGFVRKDLKRMIQRGLFREGYLDKEEMTLITSEETYHYFEQSRLRLEEQQRQQARAVQERKQAAASRDPRLQAVLDRGNAFVDEIRRCNDDIPGVEVSAKIYHMEMVLRKILERAQAHPEILSDLNKLMDYYLPMTVKLLNAYREMDAQPVQGQNIQASKLEIEKALDTLNQAYEKLLDDLFQETALDVSSDISVLNTLLAQEGLAEDDLTKLKKKNTL